MYPYGQPAPYPYAYPPPPPPMGYGYGGDDRKKKIMLAALVIGGVGFWYYKTHYKNPAEMVKHLTGKLDKITLGDIAKSGVSQYVKHKLGTTGKFVWLAKELEPLVKPKIMTQLPTEPLPDDFLDTVGDTYSFVATEDPNEYIVLKDVV